MSDLKPDAADESRSSRGYQVRLIIEPGDDGCGFLKLDIHLPFVPSVGLRVRLKDITDAGWWDEFTIHDVEWIVTVSRFECSCTGWHPETMDGNKLDEFYRAKGWTPLA